MKNNQIFEYLILIRMLLLFIVSYCLTACAIHPEAKQEASFAPLFYGRYESITDKDRAEILNVAKTKVTESSREAVIENVKIFNAKEVDVTYDVNGSLDTVDSFELFKINGHWKVI